jgi:uncharacterized protein YfiM (DUF2279 family)
VKLSVTGTLKECLQAQEFFTGLYNAAGVEYAEVSRIRARRNTAQLFRFRVDMQCGADIKDVMAALSAGGLK